MDGIEGRVVLVTGGARGIGRAIAEAFGAAKARVIVADRDETVAVEAAQGLEKLGAESWAFGLDVTDAAACVALAARVAERIGPLGVLVNSAGVIFPGHIEDATAPANWTRTLDVNVTGSFNTARAFHSQLRATRGVVINLASIRSFVAAPNATAYAASKGAVLQFTKALAVEWGQQGIRVNAIAPGFIETTLVPAVEKTPEREAWILSRVPLKRIGEPRDVAGAAVFLASSAATYITGAILAVDGGFLAG